MKMKDTLKARVDFKMAAVSIARAAGATITGFDRVNLEGEHCGPGFVIGSPLGELRGTIYSDWIPMRFADHGDHCPPHGSFNNYSGKWNIDGNTENRAAVLEEFRWRMEWASQKVLVEAGKAVVEEQAELGLA